MLGWLPSGSAFSTWWLQDYHINGAMYPRYLPSRQTRCSWAAGGHVLLQTICDLANGLDTLRRMARTGGRH